jgi:hypothetical protein
VVRGIYSNRGADSYPGFQHVLLDDLGLLVIYLRLYAKLVIVKKLSVDNCRGLKRVLYLLFLFGFLLKRRVPYYSALMLQEKATYGQKIYIYRIIEFNVNKRIEQI